MAKLVKSNVMESDPIFAYLFSIVDSSCELGYLN